MGYYDTANEYIHNNRLYKVGDLVTLNDQKIYYDIDGPSYVVPNGNYTYSITEIYPNANIKICIKYHSGSIYFQGYSGAIYPSQIASGGAQYKYTISYDANGGTGAPGNQEKTLNKNLTISLEKPSRIGYLFEGWSDSKTGAKKWDAGGIYVDNRDAVLYALWEILQYTLNVNPNGGIWNSSTETKVFKQNYNSIKTIANPVRTGYTFNGWTKSGSGNLSGTQFTYGAGNTTLTAEWKINSYMLKVKPNGGMWNDSISAQEFRGDYNSVKTIANPVRTGYTFNGWTKSGSGSLSGTQFTYGAGNTTLAAKWNVNSYILTIKPNGGIWKGEISSQTLEQNYKTSLVISNPTRVGYTFRGWNLSGGGSLSGTTYTYGAGNATLEAQWQKVTYTVTFNAEANGGIPNSTDLVEYGDAIGVLPVPTKQFYKFIGWYTNVVGGNKITSNQIIQSNVTYYAQYKIDASAILFIDGQRKPVIVYVNQNGVWRKTLTMVNSNGTWKNSLGVL